MKFSKKVMITLFMCFFISGTVFTIVSSTLLKVDLNNAFQQIGSIVLYNEWEEWLLQWMLTEEDWKLKIIWSWNNFIINSDNSIQHSENSNILWWKNNVINGWNYSTVYGWSWNYIQSDGSFIWWWNDNVIFNKSSGSVIVWWIGNKISSLGRNSENSVVIWNNNEVNGLNSSVVWNNSIIWSGVNEETYNSVAMWSWAIVVWNNSFLWVDWSEEINLLNDDVFVVFSKNGMAINQSKPNSNAKFNVWWHFVISSWDFDDNIQCGNGNGTWIIKIVDRDDIVDQKCLCNCDGIWWKSMIWDGQCQSICGWEKSDVFPECVTWWIKKIDLWGKTEFSWECIWWSVIETSYFVDWNTVWWQCQWKNGNTVWCSYKSECTWYIPGSEGVQINNNLVPSIWLDQNEYRYSIDKLEVCTYSCKTWYALDSNKVCSKVCSENSEWCNLWEIINLNQATYTNEYEYGCKYNEELYKCKTKCNGEKIWNGSQCVEKQSVCGSEKYGCLLWKVSNTWMNLQNFIWDCIDETENVIWSCYKKKEVIRRIVYYSQPRGLDGNKNVYFYMTGDDIPVDLKIKQVYRNDSESNIAIYTIPANQKISNKKVFSQTIDYPVWYTGKDYSIIENILYVPVNDKLYKLEIKDDNSLCVNSCSTAWQCSRWVSSNFQTWMNGNKAVFRWQCEYWGVRENCMSECDVDAWQCGNTSVSNSVSCDPSNDSECKIKWLSNINFTNFYMDRNEEKIVWSQCGSKRHCVYDGNTLYISCTESVNNCVQAWFKCKDGYVLSGCSCISISSICKKTTNPWKCITWMIATGYSKWEWKSNYSYYCQKEGMQKVLCEADCGSGKIWNGSSCIVVPNLCGNEHNNCINQSSLKSNQKDDFEKKYKRTCKLWNNIQDCSECYSWYIMSGDVCVVKPAIDCEATTYKWYRVPYLANGGEKNVKKNTRDSLCHMVVRCETWVLKTKTVEYCLNVCNTWTNLWSCTGSSVKVKNYIWNIWESTYAYICQDGSGNTFDRCYSKCPSWEYWDGSKCGSIDRELCSESHYNCINGAVFIQSSNYFVRTMNTWYDVVRYGWKCKLWDYKTWCMEIVNEVHNCVWWTYDGYYIKNGMNHLQELSVTKTVNGERCTATAICESGTVNIRDEYCTNACPWWILDVPKCSFTWVNPSFYQSATWTSGYTYKCVDFSCSANCSNGKIWNGSKCVNRITACNNTGVKCDQWFKSQVKNEEWWSTWNCRNIDNENLNESICYKCNSGYKWEPNKNECIEIPCGAVSKNGYSIRALSWSENTIVGKNIENGSCTVTARCSKWILTLTWEDCSCDAEYYLNGRVCDRICNPESSNVLCNGPYTRTWITRWNGYNVWWYWYYCIKDANSSVKWENVRQCVCWNNKWWNGNICTGVDYNNVCGLATNQCNSSVFIEWSWWNWWDWWRCWVQWKESKRCIYCTPGYDWNESLEKCVLGLNDCGWIEPILLNIEKWPATYYGNYDLERSYIESSTAELNSCQWRCASGYVGLRHTNWNIYCVKNYNCDLDNDGEVSVKDLQMFNEVCNPLYGCTNCPLEDYDCGSNDFSNMLRLCYKEIM